MAIKGLEVNYIPEEDRMLLTINASSEDQHHLYLTRRFVQLAADAMLEVFAHTISHSQSALSEEEEQHIMFMEHEMALGAEQQSQMQMSSYPLEESVSQDPILVTQMHITQYEQDVVISFISEPDQSRVDLCVEPPVLHSLYDSMADVSSHADWNIVFNLGPSLPEITLDKSKLN